jgi:DNA-directed RNA polymerase subunit K/omega
MNTNENISLKIDDLPELDDFEKSSVLSEEEYQEEEKEEKEGEEKEEGEETDDSDNEDDNDSIDQGDDDEEEKVNDESDEDRDEDRDEDDMEEIKKSNTPINKVDVITGIGLDKQDTSEDESEDEDSESDDEYIIKFNNDIKKDHILQHHPEIIQSNYDEITALCSVVKDKNGSVIDPIHKTIPILTKYEQTRILGLRTKQLNSGAQPFITVPDNIVEGYLIAEMELHAKTIPFIVVRPLPGGKKEYWYLKDLEMVDY